MAEPRRVGELIASCPDSHGEIAAKLGVDKSLVTRWRSGKRQPTEEQLAELERLYGRRAEEPAPPPPSFPDESLEREEPASRPRLPARSRPDDEDDDEAEERPETNNARLHRFIREGIRALEFDAELSGVKRAEALKKLVDAQVALDRSTGENALTLARIVQHPEFLRVVKLITDALVPHPEALRDARKALESVGG